MSGGTPQHICFYSNKCDWSKAFLTELAKTPFKKEFNFICVDPDNNGKRPPLPGWLKKVPTLVIKGDQEPIKTDAEVLNWLYQKKMLLSGGGSTNAGVASGGGGAAEPEAWVTNEMGGGLRDAYSFIDDSGAHARNFEMLGAPGTRTGSDLPGASRQPEAQKTKKEQLFDSQMENYMKNRENGMPQRRPAAQ
jgi:hypothetical protein